MLISREDRNIHYSFSPFQPPVAEIQSGQIITLQTRDASNGQIRPGKTGAIDPTKLLPLTGPLTVADAEPGDAVAVRIEKIALAPAAYSWLRPGLGLKNVEMPVPYYVKELPVGENVLLPGDITLALRPMIGILGVAPNEETSARTPGDHGGNLDSVDLTNGNTLWLPVLIPRAKLSFGDVHAVMGEGEVCGTGAEIDAEITVRVSLHHGFSLEGPVIATPEKVSFLVSDSDVYAATRTGLDRAVDWIIHKRGLSMEDAAIVASLAGNVRICQLVNGKATVSFELSREVLPW